MKKPATAFVKPSIGQVELFMQQKRPDWPIEFVKYYAEKFVAHYTSNGWKVSGKAAMKDWQAAFVSRWKQPTFKEDIDFLAQVNAVKTKTNQMPTQAEMKAVGKEILYVDEILDKYKKHPTAISTETLASCNEWLRQHGCMKLTDEQKKIVMEKFNQDKIQGKAVAVKFVFDHMAMKLKTFSELIAHV